MFRPHKKLMDFDLALFLMLNALRAPNKLYQHTKRLKQIRNHWHRDDPCLTAMIIGILFISGIIYDIALPFFDSSAATSIGSCLIRSSIFVFVHFVLSGIIISSVLKWIAENYMVKIEKQQKSSSGGGTGGAFSKSSKDGQHTLGNIRVEPMYAFDIHCNSFFPVVIISYGVQVSISFCTKSNIVDFAPSTSESRLHLNSAFKHFALGFCHLLLLYYVQRLCR